MTTFYPNMQRIAALQSARMLINGEWIESVSQKQIENINPATQEVLGKIPLCTADEVDKAVQAAHKAYTYWREVPTSQRRRLMFKFQALIRDHQDELARNISLEQGKTAAAAKLDVAHGLEAVEYAAGSFSLLMGETAENASNGIDTYTFQQPLGVCAAIPSFSFPAMIPLWMYSLAIAVGNTFVLKPSEYAPTTVNILGELAQKAGFPKGVLNVVHGGEETAGALIEHPLIRAVSFAGPISASHRVFTRGTEMGKRVQVLLGAKNHAVVMPDANKEKTLKALIDSAFRLLGQNGMALSVAVFVGSSKEWIPELVQKARQLKVGPGLDVRSDLGSLISPSAKQQVLRLVEEALQEGAELVLDGRSIKIAGHEKGNFVGPTIFKKMTREMSIYEKEIDGPVLLLFESTSLDHAISIINNSRHGSSSVIFTESGEHARHFQHFIDTGQVGINISSSFPLFSYAGLSGSVQGDLHTYGRHAICFYTQTKAITTRWFGKECRVHENMPKS